VKGSESRRSIAHDPDALSDAEALLAKYPDVSADEHDRIGRFLRKGAPIDIGLLSSNGELWETAERFRLEHPRYFKLGGGVYAGWAVALIGIVGGLILIQDLGLN
jgi:hypothetical protein